MVEVAAAVDAIAGAGGPASWRCSIASRAIRPTPRTPNLRGDRDDARCVRAADRLVGPHARHGPARSPRPRSGRRLIEKHLTLDRSMPGPDQRDLARAGRVRAHGRRHPDGDGRASGRGEKVPAEAERAIAAVARRSLHWARRPAGRARRSPRRDLVALRPGPESRRRGPTTSSAGPCGTRLTAGAMVATTTWRTRR